MVKIEKGEHKTSVTIGAYESIFKPLGYTLVEEKKKIEIPKVKVNEAFKGKNKKQED